MGATYRGKAMRLAKYLAHAGVASRRAAEDLIRAGRVAVDGEVVGDLGRQLDGGEEIRVDGEVVGGPEERVVWLVHKPSGGGSAARGPHGRPAGGGLVPGAGAAPHPRGRPRAGTNRPTPPP